MSQGTFEICSVGEADEVNDLALHARADREWRVWTRGFVARRDGCEAGLLMLDFYDRTFTAKVHELFVLRHSRGVVSPNC